MAHCHIEFTDNPAKYSLESHRNFAAVAAVISEEVTELLELGVIVRSIAMKKENVLYLSLSPMGHQIDF